MKCSSNYPYDRYDAVIRKQITFRPVSLNRDCAMLHEWMQQPHVIPYWHLDIPMAEYERHLQESLADSHQILLIGELDGKPMSYWESYDVEGDIIGNYYDYQPYDQGVHLLIGPETFLGKGLVYPFLLTLLFKKFSFKKTTRIVAEPDVRNEKMIHVFKKCGFRPEKKVKLPDKTGLLMVCERSDFESRWTAWNTNQFMM